MGENVEGSISVGSSESARWLRAQAARDWTSAGLPAFADWDPAVVAVMRTIAHAQSPMALMIGRRGIVAANRCAERLFAEKVGGSINGRSVFEVLPESAAFYASVLERASAGEGTIHRDQPIRLIHAGRAQTSWFNLDFTPVTARSGRVLGVLGVASDVTFHVERMRSLSESERRLRLALEGSGMVGVWTLDVATNLCTADARVARTYGLPELDCRDGLDDARFVAAIHPDDRVRVGAELERAIRSASNYRCRYRIVGKDGQLRWVITSATPALDEDGRIERLLGVLVDVTDQMETASALAESRFQFKTLTEALPQIVWSCDAEGRHDYFSMRWSEFTGIGQESITEDTWKQLVHPEHWPLVSKVWHDALRTGEPYDIDYRFRHHSGEYRWLRVMALPIRDEEGRITRWFGTSTDVHETYLVAQEREHLQRELERIATEDQLTQVLTRRAFTERAAARLRCPDASPEQTGLLMLDIDHFKSINDTYGHPGGDKVLAIAADRMKACLEHDDLVGRLGGEEFAVLLVDRLLPEARRTAERIRHSIQEQPVELGGGSSTVVTVSIGLAMRSSAEQTLEQLLLSADGALYEAKANGRNRVLVARARRERRRRSVT
ncbi:MAG TPA: diguanylate cyclase [Dokdonella sp.]